MEGDGEGAIRPLMYKKIFEVQTSQKRLALKELEQQVQVQKLKSCCLRVRFLCQPVILKLAQQDQREVNH